MDIFDHLNAALTQAKVLQARLDAVDAGAIQENLVSLRTSLSECIRERDEARTEVARLHGAVAYVASGYDRALVKLQESSSANRALNTALAESNTQRDNLREFNDKQRQQLESLQKEMAAIHMCVTAQSRSKLYDAIAQNAANGQELPFLLKAVYDAMDKYFSAEYAAKRCAGRIDAARKELES